MTVPTFGKPAATTEGDVYPVKDNGGHLLIIKPKGFNPSRPTKNTPEGAPCVTVDLVDLDDLTGQFVYRNVPLFGGALVDATKPALDAGEIIVAAVRMVWNKNGSREYPVLDPVEDTSRAADYYRRNGDPFVAPAFTAPAQPQQQQQAPQGAYGQPPAQQAPQSGYGQPQPQYAPPQQQPQYAPQPGGYAPQPQQQQPQYAPQPEQQSTYAPAPQPDPWGTQQPQPGNGAPY